MAAPSSRAARCRDGRAPRAPRAYSGMSPLSSIGAARPAAFSAPMSLAAVESFFDLHARKTTVARELRGGVSTFLTMAYILFDRARHRIRDDLLRGAGGVEGARRRSPSGHVHRRGGFRGVLCLRV